jgi:PqqD family protein of HPr-rel-A system
MSPASEPRWELAQGSQLHWKCWDDEFVVFDEGSGDTHLLDALAAEVLKALEDAPGDVPTLIARVAGRLRIEPDPEIERHIRATMQRFREAGLAERTR